MTMSYSLWHPEDAESVRGRADVPDGDLVQLKQAAARVQQLSDANYNTLQPPSILMAAKAWVGPTARDFSGKLDDRQRELQSALKTAVHLAQQAVRDAASKSGA
jgi:uncharacterized protein YhjY with autotransporter beta-barrel domain